MRSLHVGIVLGAASAWAVAAAFYTIPERPTPPIPEGRTIQTFAEVRKVRVLIGSRLARMRVRAETDVDLRSSANGLRRTIAADTWGELAAAPGGGLSLGGDALRSGHVTISTAAPALVVSFPDRDGWGDERAYPGTLRVLNDDGKRLDVINEVEIDTYVACVTANEVWPTFHQQAYRAQTIVARSYVLYQMSRRDDQAFDVTATQGSQVYRGLRRDTTGQRAAEAARFTRGIVLTWNDSGTDRLFCTYYCAACGGTTQPGAVFGAESNVEPLSGNVKCDYCRIAPGETYRWGPVRISWSDLRNRLLARYPGLESLGRLRSIEVAEKTDHGRAVTIRLTGSSGESREWLAERFRLALGAAEIRSTDFALDRDRRGVVFKDGKGFGHGLGLCQWGMEGQAREGRTGGAILRYYYPGARLTRVY